MKQLPEHSSFFIYLVFIEPFVKKTLIFIYKISFVSYIFCNLLLESIVDFILVFHWERKKKSHG